MLILWCLIVLNLTIVSYRMEYRSGRRQFSRIARLVEMSSLRLKVSSFASLALLDWSDFLFFPLAASLKNEQLVVELD